MARVYHRNSKGQFAPKGTGRAGIAKKGVSSGGRNANETFQAKGGKIRGTQSGKRARASEGILSAQTTPYASKGKQLKDQRALIEQRAAGKPEITYGYLRSKSDRHGKAGTVYYVGKAAEAGRPYAAHAVKGAGSVPVPKNAANIRLMSTAHSRQQVHMQEERLITQYGRYRNRSGQKISDHMGSGGRPPQLMNIQGGTKNFGTAAEKAAARARYAASKRPQTPVEKVKAGFKNAVHSVDMVGRKIGVYYDNNFYNDKALHKNGMRRQSEIQRRPGRTVAAAHRNGVSPAIWGAITPSQRSRIRYARSKNKPVAPLLKEMGFTVP